MADFERAGEKQAAALPLHRYLARIRFAELAQTGRVALYCSPMERAMRTSQAISKAVGLRVTAVRDVCEHGGLFTGSGCV